MLGLLSAHRRLNSRLSFPISPYPCHTLSHAWFRSSLTRPASHCLCVSSQIRAQLEEEEINIYQFPDCDSDEDEDFKRQDAEMKVNRQGRDRGQGGGELGRACTNHAPALQESIPFAVVGSCEVVRAGGGTGPVRGRRYSWGTVEGE